MKNKKAALELSVGTIVIIVIAMSMLILGLILVRNIFSGATDATELINNNVKAQINKLFNDDDRRTVIYLADNQADVRKGESYNIRFAIKNTILGESGTQNFNYIVEATEVESNCQLTLAQANSFIILGRTGGPVQITPGGSPQERIVQIRVSEEAPLCSITYDLRVTRNGQPYDNNFFIVQVRSR